ncbi:hypothetical protein DSO57_1036984 [Entomophthora muscae]|uniref:Uncharacterized protein n=1 Tax=Entomophthora muscae TaxID=34485 RepID=A0ACC2TXS7_9FUNG|nr:hypothetical protein DSO57_1036984 [Entomophthora muscae]
MHLRILTISYLVTWSSGSCMTLSSKTAEPIPPTEIEGLAENLAWIRPGDFKHQYRKKKNPIPLKYCRQTYGKPSSKVCFEVISQGYLLGEAIPIAQLSSGRYSAKVEEEQSYSAVGEDADETWPRYLLEYFPPEASAKTSTYPQQLTLQQRSYRKPHAFRPCFSRLPPA